MLRLNTRLWEVWELLWFGKLRKIIYRFFDNNNRSTAVRLTRKKLSTGWISIQEFQHFTFKVMTLIQTLGPYLLFVNISVFHISLPLSKISLLITMNYLSVFSKLINLPLIISATKSKRMKSMLASANSSNKSMVKQASLSNY